MDFYFSFGMRGMGRSLRSLLDPSCAKYQVYRAQNPFSQYLKLVLLSYDQIVRPGVLRILSGVQNSITCRAGLGGYLSLCEMPEETFIYSESKRRGSQFLLTGVNNT
jgi:hypothetical protein